MPAMNINGLLRPDDSQKNLSGENSVHGNEQSLNFIQNEGDELLNQN